MADMESEPGCKPVLQAGQNKECCNEDNHSHCHDGKPYPTSPFPPNPFPTTKAPPAPAPLDFSKFGIVQATQYGALERCQHLVEVEGIDVNQPDDENVTLLHWAAINNRIEITQYFISKGADINKKGGNLEATPIHWAVRQGHLQMVICLLKFGADPRSMDIEGCTVLHVAAQFSQTAIVGYLIAKGVGVDILDQNNMTPLMWSAYRSFGIDTTRLLIAMKASINKADKVKRNTALHWAVMSNNHNVLKILLDAGASLDAQNEESLTPRDLAVQKNNLWVIKLFDRSLQERGQGKPSFLKSLTTDKVIRRKVQFALPIFLMFAIGAVLDFSSTWTSLIISAAVLYGFSFLIVRLFWDSRAATSPMPVALYLATKFYMYTSWFLWFWPFVNSWSVLIPFFLTSVCLAYNFTKAWQTDPGFIKTSMAQQKQTIVDLAERGTLDIARFCSTCLVRKPIRSKHCSVCDKCVAKMDHHCPWIDNCVGAGNHHYFIGYLTFLFIMINYYCYGAITYFSEVCGPHDQGFWTSFTNSLSCSPWVAWGLANGVFHFLWVGALFVCQLYQVFWVGMTTNERMNAFRYSHFKDYSSGAIQSPFSHGVFKNIANFFNFSFCGLIKPDPIDWYTLYELRTKYSV